MDYVFERLGNLMGIKRSRSARPRNFKCLEALMEAYKESCGVMSDYGLEYSTYFVEACESRRIPTEALIETIRLVCQ